jgi:hypothetical protein
MLTMITSEWNSTLEQRYTYRHGSGGFAIGTTFGLLGIQRESMLNQQFGTGFCGFFRVFDNLSFRSVSCKYMY